MAAKPRLVYCSWSKWKKEEWEGVRQLEYESGAIFDDLIEFEFREVKTCEPLLCNLEEMVSAKAESAYRSVGVPCVVEHAGLILEGYELAHYPGGLTQPMWDALGAEKFVASCAPLSSNALARAAIGYCDGADIFTFVGETKGTLRALPAGRRDFYWDTIFCPEGFGGSTYAQIADKDLSMKLEISQSIRALRKFVAYRIEKSPILFPGL